MRPHGRAQVSSKNPQAFAICDRCGFLYNHKDLGWQYDWGGASLINKRILVCRPCMDEAQEQLRAIVLPPDPVPIINPRVEPYALDETNYTVTTSPPIIDPITGIPIPQFEYLLDENGQNFVEQPVGQPTGYIGNAVMPVQEGQLYAEPIPFLSILSTGTNVITVTCSTPHGLATNDQISVQGLTNVLACGMFSITVTTATAFTYSTAKIVPAGTLQQSSTQMITAIMGLPYGFTQIPQVGS